MVLSGFMNATQTKTGTAKTRVYETPKSELHFSGNNPIYRLSGVRDPADSISFQASRSGGGAELKYGFTLKLLPVNDKPYRSPPIREESLRNPPEHEAHSSSPKLLAHRVYDIIITRGPTGVIPLRLENEQVVFNAAADDEARSRLRLAAISPNYGQLRIGDDLKAHFVDIDDMKLVFVRTVDAVLSHVAAQLVEGHASLGLDTSFERMAMLRDLIVLRDGVQNHTVEQA
jgi:hypothetical protein